MLLFSFEIWWSSLTGTEQIFWSIALIATPLFLIQVLLSMMGIDAETDVETDLEIPEDGGFEFSILSLRALLVFTTFFSWVAIAAIEAGAIWWVAALIGALAGYGMAFLVAYAIFQMSKMGESGTVDMQHAIGGEGEVYLSIPEEGKGVGKVHLKVSGSLREQDAITNGPGIPTGTRVRVLGLSAERQLIVEAIR